MICSDVITGSIPTARITRQAWLLPALLILFFCSGVSALIYQVLWLRLLGLVFGVTTYAAEYKTIARTFLSVFPEATAWIDGTLLLGSVEPLQIRRSDFEWKLLIPGRAEGARDLGVTSFDQLLSLYRAGPAELREYLGQAQSSPTIDRLSNTS